MSVNTRSAAELIKLGYRRVSNKSKMIARVDREDWQKVLLDNVNPAILLNQAAAADHYRRCFSKDTIELGWDGSDVFKEIPSSSWDPVGFVGPDGVEVPPYVVTLMKDNLPMRGGIEEALYSIFEWTHARSGDPSDDDKALHMIRTIAATALGISEEDPQKKASG